MPDSIFAETPDALSVKSTEDGRISVELRGDDDGRASIIVDAEQLSILAITLLKAGVVAHNKSGKPLANSVENETLIAHVIPTTLALGPSHLSDHDSVILRFGEAALGVAIPRRQLIALAQAIAALTAGGQPQ